MRRSAETAKAIRRGGFSHGIPSRGAWWRWFCCALAVALSSGALGGETLRFTYRFGAPSVERGKRFQTLRMEGLPSWAEAPGAPILPRQGVRILLPAGSALDAVAVRDGSASLLPGRYVLRPGETEHSPIDAADDAPQPPTAPDPEIYNAPGPYPARSHENHGIGRKHGRAVLLLTLCPVRYYPRKGEVRYLRYIDVEVKTRPFTASENLAVGVPRLRGRSRPLENWMRWDLTRLVENPPRKTERLARREMQGGGAGGEVVAYAIVTSDELAPAFEPLAQARSAGGLPARVFTLPWIRSRYNGLRPDGGEDDATRIRNFITEYYEIHGLRYVLLGGDADGDSSCQECEPVVIPTRYLQSQALFADPIPADMYFGCLDGTFDHDGDGVYGEPSDGEDGGEVDFLFEVHVGRAPVDSLEEASNLVAKTLAYEASGGSVLRDVLLVGEYLGFGGEYDWGGNLNDQIRSGSDAYFETTGFESSDYADFFRIQTLYDRDTLGANWPPATLLDRLTRGVHLVNHIGHADISNVMKLTNAEIDSLSGEAYFLGYTQSCYAAAFDNRRTHGAYGADSVAEHLLSGPAGAAALVANSRRGWASSSYADGPSQRFNRMFWHVVFSQGLLQWGAANDRSKEENYSYLQANTRARSCAFGLNTLGDPALTMKFAGPRASLSLDGYYYLPGSEVGITVIDSDLDVTAEEPDLAQVTVRALVSGDEEVAELVESARSTAVFQGTLAVDSGEPAADGKLQTAPRDTIVVIYEDADDGSGNAATIEKTAHGVVQVTLVGKCPPDGALGVPYSATLEPAGGLPPFRLYAEGDYAEDLMAPHFEGLGVPQRWQADDGAWNYALPFEFPFYGKFYSSVLVSSNGYLELGGGYGTDFVNSLERLIANTRIAPLWADLTTSNNGDIFIDEKADSVALRWAADEYGSGDLANFEVELFTDGTVRFGYGSHNDGLSPTIGISAGDGERYIVSALNGREELSNASAVYFFPSRLPRGLALDPSGEIAGVPEEVFRGTVSFRVEDSLGQTASRICHLEITPDGLALEAPRAGDLWLLGGHATIRWDWFGNVGNHLRIDYNTDGTEDAFPHSVVDEVPLTARSYVWSIPELPGAPLPARVRIQSRERPEFFTHSEIFYLVGPTLVILSPAAGERWAVGGEALVSWQSVGEVGEQLRIDYNLTGSEEVFPFVLADDVPDTGELRVPVPSTPAETCRLRIQSLSDPGVQAVSESFSIRLPSLTIVSPNGGECLRTGEGALVTWRRDGFTGEEVILEYNTDGDTEIFPFQVGDGALPNTESAVWIVPATPFPHCRLRIRSPTLPGLVDISDGTFSTEHRCAIRALIWVPYIPIDEEQVTGLVDAILRFEPDFEPTFSTQTTPEALRGDLAQADAFLIPKQKRAEGVDFTALGQRLGPVIEEFLARGGATVVCQQTFDSERFLEATGLLHAVWQGEGTRLCEVAQPLHPVVLGVRPNFPGPISTAWYEIDSPVAQRLVTAGGATVVASRELGFGRLAFLGFDYYSFNDQTARIVANASRVALPDAGIRLSSPDPGRGFLVGEQIPVRWFALGEARGDVAISHVSSYVSETPGDGGTPCPASAPCLIAETETADDGQGSYTWTAPPLPEEASVLEMRIRVESLAAPQHVDISPSPFYVIRPLTVATESLPEANVGLPYEAEIRVTGGLPPYTFTVLNLPAGLVSEVVGDHSVRIAGTPQRRCENCEVTVVVEDATGTVTRKFLPLSVVQPQIWVVAPNNDEILFFGGTFQVRWRKEGSVGETVTLSFNTDGSRDPDAFPFEIARGVPLDGTFLWQVPPITAGSCRLKVQSEQFPQYLDVSDGTFSVVGPSLHLETPNGGECWDPGWRRTIRWNSTRNEEDTVRVEYSTAGLDGAFELIASGLPSSGEVAWTVPEALSEECVVRVRFENIPGIEDTSDGPFRIQRGCPLRIVHWSPCPGSEQNDENIRQALRERVAQLAIRPSAARSPDALAAELKERDALVVSLMSVCQTLDYEALGRDMRPVVEPFVEGGGVVVFCGPHERPSGLLAGLGLLDELELVASGDGLPCEVTWFLHPVTREVPLEFTGPLSTFSYGITGGAFETLVESTSGSVVATVEQSFGRWLLLGFDFEERDPQNSVHELLLERAVRPGPIVEGLRLLSPRPRDVFAGSDPVTIEWAAQGTRTGDVVLSYNTDGSSEVFPLEIAVVPSAADGGSFSWTAPQPPPAEYFTCRIRVMWAEPPHRSDFSEGVFFVTDAPLQIDTESLPEADLGRAYEAEVRVSGGLPPYSIAVLDLPAGLETERVDGRSMRILGAPQVECRTCEVTVVVEDATGLVVRKFFPLPVVKPTISLLQPRGGEILLGGSVFEVRWRSAGRVGDTVSLSFNTDGSSSPDAFPQEIANSVPIDEPFLWEIPRITAASCRLNVQSEEFPEILAISEAFSILAQPTIRLGVPNGGECWEPGRRRWLRWQSVGNDGGTVRLEFTAVGLEGDFQVVAAGLPASGEYLWTVPDAASENCFVRVSFEDSPDIEDVSDGAFSIQPQCGLQIVHWSPCPSDEPNDENLREALAGGLADVEIVLTSTREPDVLWSLLANRDALVISLISTCQTLDYQELGSGVRPALEAFVNNGGVVLFTAPRPRSSRLLAGLGLLEQLELLGSGEGVPCQVSWYLHPVTREAPLEFLGPLATSSYALAGGEWRPVVESNVGVVVATVEQGLGRWLLFGFDFQVRRPEDAIHEVLLARAVRPTAIMEGLRILSPRPRQVFAAGDPLPIEWAAEGTRAGDVLLSYNTDGSTELFPLEIATASSASDGDFFLWTAPQPPAGSFFTCRIQVSWTQPPELPAYSQDVFFVTEGPLQFVTASLPEANVGLFYETEIRVTGGLPPYVFTVDDLPAGLAVDASGEHAVEISGIPQIPCEHCEVRVVVEDATGFAVEAFLALPVVPRTLSLIQPNGGEALVFGDTYEVRWKSSGRVGETVSLSFNIDGSLDPEEFPFDITPSHPIGESFVWQVPAITAERCRLKVQSNQYPEFFSVSEEVFSLVGPTLHLTQPDGDECWSPGWRRRIEWVSTGNDDATVRIEYSTDGIEGSFQVIAAGLANTGTYVWTVPVAVSGNCIVRILFENAPIVNDASDSVFGIQPDCGLSILHWSPCPGTEPNDENIRQALANRIADVEIVPTTAREAERLAADLENRDALVVSLMSICWTLDYEDLGRSVRPFLEPFVENGGVVVFCNPAAGSSRLLAGLGLLERLQLVSSAGGLPCEVSWYLHPVTREAPLDFSGAFMTSSYRVIGGNFQNLVESTGDPVVATVEQGFGRWLLFGFSFQLRDPEKATHEELLASAVRPQAVLDGLRVLSPRPHEVFAAGDPLTIEWAAQGTRSGALRLLYNVDGSTELFPLEIEEVDGSAAGGSFLWHAPQPAAGEHLTCRLQVSWSEPPHLAAHSSEVFFVTERTLRIETEALPDGYQRAEYSAEVRVSGGAPPYVFETFELPAGLFLPSPDGNSPASWIAGAPLETTTNRAVTLRVTDATGAQLERVFHVNIFPSRLELLSPAGGEYLLAGASHEVRWQIFGNVGNALTVRYNLDGNTRDFPEIAAEAVPLDVPFLWEIPADLRSERCRLQISSELGYQSVSARTFAITGPGITCLYPNGNEVLETDGVRTIRWRSLGNPDDTVKIELLFEGSADDMSLVIADAVPDSGSFSWNVTAIPWETCRLRVLSRAAPDLADTSDSTFAIRYRKSIRGLIWMPYTGFDRLEVRGAIAAVTIYEHDFDWRLSQARTPEEVRSELVGKETFLMVQQEPRTDVNFGARGRALGPVLREFAERGGTVVMLKQRGAANDFLPATGLLKATQVDEGFDVVCQVALPDHPVMNQVPEAFRAGAATGWYDVESEGAEVYATAADEHAVVVGSDIEDGRVVLIGFDYRDYTDASARVLANAVRMTRPTGRRTHFVRGDADTNGRLNIVDAIFILEYLFRSGAEPPCFDAADVDDSAMLGSSLPAVNLTDAVYLLCWLFSGSRPPPPPTPGTVVGISSSCGTDGQFRDGLECESYPLCNP